MPCLRWGAIATLAQGSGAMLRKTVQVLMIIGLGTVGSLGVPDEAIAHGKGRYVARSADGRSQARPATYRTARSVARRSNVDYRELEPERTKTKTALMIGGSAAAGAGVGGAIAGGKGALIGAAVGGGAASIYEAVKRR
jgi:hypothetical protein